MNKIHPFKGRSIDTSKRIKVYRNLGGDCNHMFSIQQDGLVVAHASRVGLHNAQFVVSEAGRQRVLKQRRKNVHAFVTGFIINQFEKLPVRVTYNPYQTDSFVGTVLGCSPFRLSSARLVVLDAHNGVTAGD